MKNKNRSVVRIFTLLCIIVLPSQSLLSSASLKTRPTQTSSAAANVINTDENDEEMDEEEEAEQSQQDAATAGEKEIQAVTPAPGMLTRMYSAIAPIIIGTLNQAVGKGISASTESLISLFMARYTFTNLKNDILIKTSNIFKDNQDFQALSGEKKLEYAKELLLPEKLKKNFGRMEEQASMSYILNQSAYTGMLNTIIPMLGTLAGIGAAVTLQSLMPAQ